MKKLVAVIVSLLSLLFMLQSVPAAALHASLQSKLATMSSTDKVQVWIKLPDVIEPSQFKTDISNSSDLHRERYQLAISRMKSAHQASQNRFLSNMMAKSSAFTPANFKQHWLVNIIDAELTKNQIEQLASSKEIESISLVPKIESIRPLDNYTDATGTAGVESNISYVNAPSVWALGYHGEGRIVCSFDTGIDGNHPALHDSWKGLDGDSSAAWYDPIKQLNYPHTIPDCGLSSCNTNHGTHTMGTMIGHDDNTGDTIGVAPGAQWISAAIIDIAGATIIDAFEWAANPDGDPNTIDDLPDVINHSWGVSNITCEDDLFYNLIDMTEALGIVNIFAAGNTGASGTSTIYNPAVRAQDSLDCFAVGNIDHVNEIINGTSSRGPSTCPLGAIKPNVSAPGTVIWSSVPNNGYAPYSGTSMAAPHVSGLVALLRQKNPNATVDEIKLAILNSTSNLGQVVPNNEIGWGVIDCLAAFNALSATNTEPNLRVSAFDYTAATPGATISGTVRLQNMGANASSVSATLLNSNPSLSVLSGSLTFGTINEGDTLRSGNTVQIAIADTVTIGQILSLDMRVTATGYTDTVQLFIRLDPQPQKSILTHNSGTVQYTVSNYGAYGLDANSFFPLGGTGFDYLGQGNDLWESGLIIGQNFMKVSDGVRNDAAEPDNDFRVAPDGDIVFVPPTSPATQQSYAHFTDSRAENPIGLDIVQNVYSFDIASQFENIIILQYVIKNISGSSLGSIYVGLYNDWDIFNYLSNSGGYNSTDSISWVAYRAGSALSMARGIKVLDGDLYTSFTKGGSYVAFPSGGGEGFTELEKMNALVDGFVTADSFTTTASDLIQLVAARISLGVGQTDTVAFAVIADSNFTDLATTGTNASVAYNGISTDIIEIDNGFNQLPGSFVLEQNYPNPFNPTTMIKFALPRASEYSLEIFNITGQKVEQFDGAARAGVVTLEWDASEFSSGIYLYRLTAGDYTDSKKMMLLK